MRGLLPPDKQHQAEDRALEDAEEEAEIFETEVGSPHFQRVDDDDFYNDCGTRDDGNGFFFIFICYYIRA